MVKKIVDYFLVFLLIGVSGIPFLMQNPDVLGVEQLNVLSILFSLSFLVFINRKNKVDTLYLLIVFTLIIVIIGQTYIFSKFETEQAMSLIIRFSIPYFIIKTVKKNIIQYYITVIFVLTLISLLFFLPAQIISSYDSFVRTLANSLNIDSFQHRQSFIIYSLDGNHNRNAGAFWEPGGFGCFLLLALYFNIIKEKKIINLKNIIYIIAIITTFSTASYLGLFMLLLGYFVSIYNTKYKLIILPLVFLLSLYVFYSQEFLYQKIVKHYDSQVYATEQLRNLGRFQSAILDYNDIKENPIFGRGRGEFRYKTSENFIEYGAARRSNGLTDFITKLGLPFSIIFFVLLYKALLKLNQTYEFNRLHAISGFSIILIVGFSQILFLHPLFTGLIFLPLVFTHKAQNFNIRNQVICKCSKS